MDFRLTEEQQMIRDAALKFGARWTDKAESLRQHTLTKGEVPKEYWQEFCENGFMGALIPEQYGGSGLGLTAMTLILEAVSSHNLANALMMLTAMDALCILKAGPEPLRQRYLPKICAGEIKLAFAITEPDAGSNAFRMRTVARREGDKLILNGSKTFITAVDVVERVLVVARSMRYEELKAQGLPKVYGFNLLLVDPKAPGFTMQEMPTEGIEGFRQWTLFFDNVEVPLDELIGQEHQGAMAMFNVLNAERTLAAALSLGESEWLLKRSVEYAKQRVVFGDKPIGAYQAIQHPLAEIRAELEAARLVTYKAATLFDQNANPQQIVPFANMAKLLSGELGIKAADRAIQTHGGNGFSREFGLIQAWVNARLVRTAPISKEMILNFIGEHVLGLPRSY
ncbi:MAG: acyl-CoA/acyl-ACP dehydrogenase [Myxococcales bacterium]|nr:acyl-CoA/acyl-ACP dehydrogenase [Myxococcales bacterium]